MSPSDQPTTTLVVVDEATPTPNMLPMRVALFDATGAPISRILDTVPSGAEVVLTGFTTQSAAALAATDTVNEAFGKLQARTLAGPATGVNVLMTSYSTSLGAGGAIAATDTLNAAVRRLEDRVYGLENP